MDDKMKAAFDAWCERRGVWPRRTHEEIFKAGADAMLDYLRSQQEPFAWHDDGSIRAGSESTAHRVVSDTTKKDMPRAASISFNSPLYTNPIPSIPVPEGLRKAMSRIEDAAAPLHSDAHHIFTRMRTAVQAHLTVPSPTEKEENHHD